MVVRIMSRETEHSYIRNNNLTARITARQHPLWCHSTTLETCSTSDIVGYFGGMFFPPIGVEREYAQRPIIGHVRCAGHDMDTSVGNGDAAATSFFDMFDPCEDGPGFGSQRSPKLSDQFKIGRAHV